jgi:NAD(P)-dependent dehydrogenase (short-subunit alcohol dehydrogenase family)
MKKAVVTGASRGIGREIVLELVAQGVSVVAVSRNQPALDELAQQNNELISVCAKDISDPDCAEVVSGIVRGPLDILINNAGLLLQGQLGEQTFDNIEKMYRTNVIAPAMLTQGLLPALKKSSSAHIVNIGSMGGFQGTAKFPGLWAYSSSKAALSNMAECWAEELKDTSVRCNCLALGAVNTEMLGEAFPGYEAPVSAEDMGRYIARFAMEGHELFNGKVIPVALGTP